MLVARENQWLRAGLMEKDTCLLQAVEDMLPHAPVGQVVDLFAASLTRVEGLEAEGEGALALSGKEFALRRGVPLPPPISSDLDLVGGSLTNEP